MTMMLEAMERNDFELVTELLEDPGDDEQGEGSDEYDSGFEGGLEDGLSSGWTRSAAPERKGEKPKVYATSTHAWDGDGGTEGLSYLVFPEDVRIEILEEREAGGWWKGKVRSARLERTHAAAASCPSMSCMLCIEWLHRTLMSLPLGW